MGLQATVSVGDGSGFVYTAIVGDGFGPCLFCLVGCWPTCSFHVQVKSGI